MSLTTIKLRRNQEQRTPDDELVVLALWFLNREYRFYIIENGIDFDDLFQCICIGILTALRCGGYSTVTEARSASTKKFTFTNFARFKVHESVMELVHSHKWWPLSIPRKVASAYGAIGASIREKRIILYTELLGFGHWRAKIEDPFSFTYRRERRRILYEWISSLKEPKRSLCLLRLLGKDFHEIDRILGISSSSGRFSRIVMDLNPSLKRGAMIEMVCSLCNKTFLASTKSGRLYCSRECHRRSKIGRQRGDEYLWDGETPPCTQKRNSK